MFGGRQTVARAVLCLAALAPAGAAESCAGATGACDAGPGDELSALQTGRARVASSPPDHLSQRQLAVNGLEFDCVWTPETCSCPTKKGNVLALHGFPDSKEIFEPLMKDLARAGFCAAACDQRGYSPGASPCNESDYLPSLLQSDVLGFADELGFERFHLVGSDLGAVLGWLLAASPHKAKLLSFSSLGVPHLDALSAGLFGPAASRRQQAAAQYFEILARGSSASLYDEAIYKSLGGGESGRWPTAQAFQKAVWWYNGIFSFSNGPLALPPLLSAEEVRGLGFEYAAMGRSLFGGAPNIGKAACSPIGDVCTPTLFVCGSEDPFVLCSEPFSLESKRFVTGDYQYLQLDAGHNLLSCSNTTRRQAVMGAILAHVQRHAPVVEDAGEDAVVKMPEVSPDGEVKSLPVLEVKKVQEQTV